MKDAHASRTAEYMALFRAIESDRPADLRLFDDRFACAFLPPPLQLVQQFSRLPAVGALVPWLINRWWPGPLGAGICRTRYIDDGLRAALRDGTVQVVILGAGFDSRAYRIVGIERTRVFEVDHPATQAAKRERLARILGPLPAHVAFVAIDFNQQTLDSVLPAAGLQPTLRTFVIWEGVTNYLNADAVDAALRFLAGATPSGSRILFTYIHRGILDGSAQFEGARESIVTVGRAGEPFTFGFDPAELPAYLAARGLTLIEDVGAADYRARYLVPLGRHDKVSEFYRAVLVQVADESTGRTRV
jgi:methyltransferase (TIGR00027 family)